MLRLILAALSETTEKGFQETTLFAALRTLVVVRAMVLLRLMVRVVRVVGFVRVVVDVLGLTTL
jgi:hypothetical protein